MSGWVWGKITNEIAELWARLLYWKYVKIGSLESIAEVYCQGKI